jgi:Flp pilus assembly protein TadD
MQVYIKMNRMDTAQMLADQISSWSLDSILVQVLEAILGMATGGDKIQEALWALEELVQTYTASGYLLNLIGICHLLQNSWADAGRFFAEGVQADPQSSDAHANLSVALAAAGKDNGAQLTYVLGATNQLCSLQA